MRFSSFDPSEREQRLVFHLNGERSAEAANSTAAEMLGERINPPKVHDSTDASKSAQNAVETGSKAMNGASGSLRPFEMIKSGAGKAWDSVKAQGQALRGAAEGFGNFAENVTRDTFLEKGGEWLENATDIKKSRVETANVPQAVENSGYATHTTERISPTDAANGENPEQPITAPEGAEEAPKTPETKGEQFAENIDQALAEYRSAKTEGEKLVAGLKVIANILAYIKSAFDGTFDDPLNQPEAVSTENPEAKPGENEEKSKEEDAETRVKEELKENSKDKDGEPKDLETSISETKEKKEKEIKSNKEVLESYDEEATKLEKRNSELIDEKALAEKELSALQDEPEMATKVKQLEGAIKTLEENIATNNKRLEEIGKEKGALEEQNTKLEEDLEALDKIKKDTDTAKEESEKKVKDAAEKGDDVPFKGISIDIGPDGKIAIRISGVSPELKQKIEKDGGLNIADVSIVMEEEEQAASSGAEGEKEKPFSTTVTPVVGGAPESAEAKKERAAEYSKNYFLGQELPDIANRILSDPGVQQKLKEIDDYNYRFWADKETDKVQARGVLAERVSSELVKAAGEAGNRSGPMTPQEVTQIVNKIVQMVTSISPDALHTEASGSPSRTIHRIREQASNYLDVSAALVGHVQAMAREIDEQRTA